MCHHLTRDIWEVLLTHTSLLFPSVGYNIPKESSQTCSVFKSSKSSRKSPGPKDHLTFQWKGLNLQGCIGPQNRQAFEGSGSLGGGSFAEG